MIKVYSFLFLFTFGFLFAQKSKAITCAGTCSNKNSSFVVGKIHLTSAPKEANKTEDKKLSSNYLTVYPNPVSDVLNIRVNKDTSVIEEVCILSLDGKLLYSKKNTPTMIDVSFLNEGMFIVKIQEDKNQYSYKIIKI